MLKNTTSPLTLWHRIKIERSWKRHPREMIDERIPVRLSENPSSLVRVARNEPATIMEMKYSSAASMTYIVLPLFNALSFTVLRPPCTFFGHTKKKPLLSKTKVAFGAGGRGRTDTVSLPRDFESRTSANSITPAFSDMYSITKIGQSQVFFCVE